MLWRQNLRIKKTLWPNCLNFETLRRFGPATDSGSATNLLFACRGREPRSTRTSPAAECTGVSDREILNGPGTLLIMPIRFYCSRRIAPTRSEKMWLFSAAFSCETVFWRVTSARNNNMTTRLFGPVRRMFVNVVAHCYFSKHSDWTFIYYCTRDFGKRFTFASHDFFGRGGYKIIHIG